ncbi:unnamed protein product (macronuclear) [Paramecium tetraurelia]|uniref:Transmembrane protein n=1 Tax=Paramecium tetraurelia TaxID=5888 RepID=A0E155_PARTE|nr:uncharacterized protein GSPATT00022191001 [Paramecium tetraurelia]CAK89022.1 unnamed protein product [Paramecium tetraurelia]|eukprot:XP_001456419.1 hypothetical protein (macronuclear) [Paramecium tetraurelia strain d4-2]
MLNSYDTPDFRETIEYKGNLAFKPIKYDLKLFDSVETLICPELSITTRCQQIFLFMQMMYFFVIHMAYLIIPRALIIESPLIYVFSWRQLINKNSILVVESFQINLSPNTSKRFPINILLFTFGSFGRIFVYLFISEYFDISKFLLLNLMSISLIIYIRFKVLQQAYHTYMEINQMKNPFQLNEEFMNEPQVDKDWDLLMSRQEEDLKQLENESQEQEEEASEHSSEKEQEQVKSKGQKSEITNKNQPNFNELKQEDQLKNSDVIGINNILDFKVFYYNYMIAIIVPCFMWAFFYFPIKQLVSVLIFNILYLTFIWIHCKTYNSERRIFVLIYNMENAYLLLTAYFDSDFLCPWWMVYELIKMGDKNYQKKMRLSQY